MNKRTQHRHLPRGEVSYFLSLGLLAVFFLAGAVYGQVSAKSNPDAIAAELHQYLVGYCALDTGAEGSGRVFLSALLIYFRYPLLALFLGFTIPGALTLPIIASVFGFFLSYASCCFARAFGETGIQLAAAVFGLRCLVSLPCFLVLATTSIQGATNSLFEHFFARGKRMQVQRLGLEWWLLVSVIVAILLAGALSEVLLAPILLKKVFQSI